MRIISGLAKGTKLFTLEGIETRPTLDRVKEPLFSIIQNNIKNSVVLDLFSGSGALGLEAISRGAKKAVLCDNSKEAITVINKNIEKTRTHDKVKILNSDYKSALQNLINDKFDIIFLDPPYETDYLMESLKIIIKLGVLQKEGIIVAETNKKDVIDKISTLDVNIIDYRKYGKVILMFISRKE